MRNVNNKNTLAAKVLADVAADYSQEMADTLKTYETTNFNIAD